MNLKKLPKLATTKIIIIFILLLLFVSLFILPKGNQKTAGEVFGKKVSYKEFENSLLVTRSQAMYRYGQIYPKVRYFLDLEKQAWEQILLTKEAKNRKIRVTKQEIVKNIA